MDTAGRLHTKTNLMAELAKMARVAGREIAGAPHEMLLVLDATVGTQRAGPGPRVRQGRAASRGSCSPSSTAPPRAASRSRWCASSASPIRYVGRRRAAEDLLPFDADAFVDGLLGAVT